jgi:nucleotide-binding universal stress UspA family protein
MASVFKRLLLATEHGEFDVGAESLALSLARQSAAPLAAVLPLVSNAEFEAAAPQQAAQAETEAALRSDRLRDQAAAAGVALQLTVRRGPELDQEIVDEARQRAADLIIIRRRGKRGFLANLLVGEMVSKVVTHAPCSVLIAPRHVSLWQHRVLVGIDPLVPDPALLGVAAGLAADGGLALRLVCVASGETQRPQAETALAAALQQVRGTCSSADGGVRIGKVHQALIEEASACAADLLVIGRHVGDALGRARLGGVTEKVIGLAECPVLVHVPTARPASANP